MTKLVLVVLGCVLGVLIALELIGIYARIAELESQIEGEE